MNYESIWLHKINFDNPINLNKNLNVDVLIIGGGITGISTAYHLINVNLNVCLVERNLIAHGVTSRTTGKLTYLQEDIYSKLGSNAALYYESQKEAIKIVSEIIKNNNIQCNFKIVKSYLYTDKEKDINKIKNEETIFNSIKMNYKICKNLPINLSCKYSLYVDDTAVFHPIKYLLKLKKIITNNNIPIYENSCVTSIKKEKNKFICKVNNHTIKAKKVVIASHYPFFLSPLFVPLKTYIERSYISATEVNNTKNFSAITINNPTKSIRYHEDNKKYFIYLNGTHNLCNQYNYDKKFIYLKKELNKINLTPTFLWSNQDIMTEDSLPYIGEIDNNLYIGTGYNTWGMTNGSLAGKIISDLILNKENKYKSLFDPKRNKSFNILKYPIYISYSAKSFIENKIIKNKSWYSDNIKITKINNKKIGIYTDKNNIKHMVYLTCPHLKCSLIFNEKEKTWDCPCHASRFDIDGKCISGPSKKNINIK